MARKQVKKETPKSSKYDSAYWGMEVQNAIRREEKYFIKEAEQSIRVYNSRDSFEGLERRVNIWKYCVNTLLPALYSSTPRAEVNLRKYAGSDDLDLAAVLLERATQYSMDLDFNFDFVGLSAALSVLLTGRSVLWAEYCCEFGEAKKIKLTPGEGGLYLPDGKLYDGDPAEVEEDGKEFSYNLDTIESEKAVLKFVRYDNYINSDAQNEEEVEWRAKRGFLDRDEAEELGFDVKRLKFDSYPESHRDSKINREDRNPQNGKADIWELWDEVNGKRVFIQARGKASVVETEPVPIKFPGFYPCSVLAQCVDPNSTIPVSDFSSAKDQILEVERLAERKHGMIQACRANGIYDPALGDIMQDMFKGDLQMRPVKQWQRTRAAGGLSGGTEYLNIEPYIKGLQIASTELEAAKQSLYETLKISELMRGTSNPTKTATANRFENQWSSMGLVVRQNQFANHMGEGIEKLGTVVATCLSPETILTRGSAQQLFEPLVQQPAPQPPMQGPQ